MKKRIIGLQRFIKNEAFSSIFLLLCALIAIIWANSSHSESYFHFLHLHLGINFESVSFSMSLLHWINDGLMAVFFFVIGLEIKRELMAGQLSTAKKAILPVIAAIGGVIMPILLFRTLNYGQPGSEGWGIPMATDIAFSLGILTLLGRRVPLSLKVFLTAFAIFDDICAVAVIAIFYSSTLNWTFFLLAIGFYGVLLILNYFKLYNQALFLTIGVFIWYLFLMSGIHPSIAGVLVAFTIPANKKLNTRLFVKEMSKTLGEESRRSAGEKFLTQTEIKWVEKMQNLTNGVMPSCQFLEKNLHHTVIFFIMPLFALANAGVQFTGEGADAGEFNYLARNISLSLVLGKIIGITSFTWLAVKLKIANLPYKTNMKQIFGISCLGGFGFTMSLFINHLSYTDKYLENCAKMGILGGSVFAAISGYIILRILLKDNNAYEEHEEHEEHEEPDI